MNHDKLETGGADAKIEIKVEFNKKLEQTKLNQDLDIHSTGALTPQSTAMVRLPPKHKQLKIKELTFDNHGDEQNILQSKGFKFSPIRKTGF